ncbi:hypothetical protein SAMN05216207_102339 [Pseudonocardia ammonioxydans]|uniref:Uncharacterized protein n=1 Tax=Pseudonocardia ammonioxydans TaxID=260086 RepID=A0A1I5CJ78_PSUAM|nr:hypothetical protein [Pseudonocardia ammonioxydans]SFN87049.1 hypothetical protein SAMN05216207_102339 [Pseudonocardia ammonioxydans]
MTRTTQLRTRRTLRALVPTTLIAALGVATALSLTELPGASVAEAADRIDTATAAPPRLLLVPPPPLPKRIVPDFPLPVPAEEKPERAVVYTCDPTGNAEFGDPDNPNVVTNKSCPEINATEKQDQRQYLEQLESETVGDHREYSCSDPTSADYGTAACGTDADGDGLMDGGPLDAD